jgi:hypothetical protein
MSILLEWAKLRNDPMPSPTPVNMGNGRFLTAEDVLEGHFRRLTTQPTAQTVPAVQPEPRFRQNLHSALERTHRQHSAQRVLGTRSPTPTGSPLWHTAAPVAVLFLALFALWLYFLPAQRHSSRRA